ncbi:general secretion pathway, M protein [mine drainage metagenome]|uniref:General secretion pathway, M protein n=1 Tax=mine drainage metagenome TaxID=410659 RepID=A0A1J5SGY1_9ZZZZ
MQSWLSVTSKFEALNKRERWLVFLTLLFVVYAAINALLLSPVLSQKKTITTEFASEQSQVQQLQQQITILNSQNIIDPDAQSKLRISDLRANLQQLETQLSGMQSTLISPEKMPELLRSLLKRNRKLNLIELKTLPTQGLLETATSEINNAVSSEKNTQQAPVKAKQDEAPVYKHGVEITVEGRYLDLLEYVSVLEKMPWHVLWSKAALNVDQHTQLSQLKLTVYTLSLDKTWLSI